MEVTDSVKPQAYYNMAQITVVKSFIVLTPGYFLYLLKAQVSYDA